MAADLKAPNRRNREFERRFQEIKLKIHRQLVEEINFALSTELKPERLRNEVRALANEMVRTSPDLLSDVDRDRLTVEIINEVFGYGPIQALLNDDSVSDILVNGPDEVWIERDGVLQETDIIFANRQHLTQIIQRMANRIGRQADETSPMVDARLEDGSRINAILPPLAMNGPILSIRRFAKRLTIEELLFNETLPPEMITLLSAAIEARMSVLVSGGTGSGKTTLLNCLSRYIPDEERLVTIEDAIELDLQRRHVVQLETRVANLEGSGEVRQRELVRNSLRMRPDRIILGEVRGAEALDMLQAMNTGHEGSMTTIHANDTLDALNRLEIMVMMAGYEMPLQVIRHYITSAISLVIQLSRLKGGQRKVMRVSEVIRAGGNDYQLVDLFGFRQMGIRDGKAFGDFYATGNVPTFIERLRASGITLSESIFEKRVLQPSDERQWEVNLEEGSGDSQADFEDSEIWR